MLASCSLALAIALSSTRFTKNAARLLVNLSVSTARSQAMPRIKSTTSRALRSEMRANRCVALQAICFTQFLLLDLACRVTLEGPRRRELAQLVAHHVLSHIHRDEALAVVDLELLPDELRHDRAGAAPRTVRRGGACLPGAQHALVEHLVDERTLLQAARHFSFQFPVSKKSTAATLLA